MGRFANGDGGNGSETSARLIMFCKVVFDVPLDRDFDYAIPTELESKVMPGIRVTAPFGRMLTTGLVTAVSDTTHLPENILIKKIASVLDEKPVFGSDLFSLAAFMKETWGGPIGQILFALVPPQAFFKVNPPETLGEMRFSSPPLPLAAHRQKDLSRLASYLNNGYHRVLLSGPDRNEKTEIILTLAQKVLQGFGQALITLPDVISAQNFAHSLKKRFTEDILFCWHSRMLISQKKKIFSRVSNGLPCLIISARSGSLLPFKNLRLAAMLEEENDNYKQEENKPYFHVRDLLAFRSAQHEALFVACSDTPSLEQLYSVQQKQTEQMSFEYPHSSVAFQWKVTPKKGEKSSLISDILLEQLKENLEKKEASLLILNRRGYSNAYYCLNCGTYAKCQGCGAILAREKAAEGEDYLICKKCGKKYPLEQTCPQCQNKIFKSRGGGTQKIVTELNKLFPHIRVLRLDSDTLKNKDGQGHQVRAALDRGQADVVVGTRLALDAAFSGRVSLAAVMDADLELDSPDFRASEKFGQLIFKLKNLLAERKNSRLLIQSSSPDIYPFESLRVDYEACSEEEMLARESFQYPPFIKLIKLLLKSKDKTLLQAETSRIMSVAAPFAMEILGPVLTGKKTDILKKQYLLFKTTSHQYPDLVKVLDQLEVSKKIEVKIVADPYDFY